jgi:hypothetical protein
MAPLLSERNTTCDSILLLIFWFEKSITIERYPELHFFPFRALLSTLIAMMLLFVRTKASLHMMGISALTVFVFG